MSQHCRSLLLDLTRLLIASLSNLDFEDTGGKRLPLFARYKCLFRSLVLQPTC